LQKGKKKKKKGASRRGLRINGGKEVLLFWKKTDLKGHTRTVGKGRGPRGDHHRLGKRDAEDADWGNQLHPQRIFSIIPQ